jgi:hypothetical protein
MLKNVIEYLENNTGKQIKLTKGSKLYEFKQIQLAILV